MIYKTLFGNNQVVILTQQYSLQPENARIKLKTNGENNTETNVMV